MRKLITTDGRLSHIGILSLPPRVYSYLSDLRPLALAFRVDALLPHTCECFGMKLPHIVGKAMVKVHYAIFINKRDIKIVFIFD